MTNPFAALVGLKGVTPGTAPIYVNDISGISTELVSALTTADAVLAADAWGKVQRLALEKLVSMIEGELSKSADFRHTVAQTTVWDPKSLRAIIPNASRLQGCRFSVPYSPYKHLVIEGLFANVASTGLVSLPVKIVDLYQGLLIDTISVSRSAGLGPASLFGPVVIDIPLPGLDVFVGADCASLTLTELGGAARQFSGANNAVMTAGELIQSLPTSAGFTPTDSRIWIVTSVRNSLDEVVACYADRLQWAYAYLCGSLLMTEKLGSPNFNLYTNTNRLFTEEQETKLMEEAKTRLRPVAREMLKELSKTEVLTDKDDGPYDQGYTIGSFVD